MVLNPDCCNCDSHLAWCNTELANDVVMRSYDFQTSIPQKEWDDLYEYAYKILGQCDNEIFDLMASPNIQSAVSFARFNNV